MKKRWALLIVIAILTIGLWGFNIGSIYYTEISAQTCEGEIRMTAQNYFTGVEYTGHNATTLNMSGYKSNQWATYRQWLEGGYQVQKGQKGQAIMKIVIDKEGEKRPKFYRVFNQEQVKPIKEEE